MISIEYGLIILMTKMNNEVLAFFMIFDIGELKILWRWEKIDRILFVWRNDVYKNSKRRSNIDIRNKIMKID